MCAGMEQCTAVEGDALFEQATRAAWLYYERSLKQEEIARRMAVSRSTVSRLLTHAREVGIVEISVNRRLPEVAPLEAALHERFPLDLVIVEPKDPEDSPARAAARAGARFLSRRVRAGGVIGVGWGETLRTMAQLVNGGPVPDLTFVDVVGRPPGGDSLVAVSRLIARTWWVEAVSVPAPAFAATREMRDQLHGNPVVDRALATARAADLIVLSIGGAGPRATLVKEGIVSGEAMGRLRDAGAVGDLLGHFYDSSGTEVTLPDLVGPIGLGLGDLRAAKLVVAVAAGRPKVEAIRAAAAARLITGLITDNTTASALLHR
jgi:DNA-binding transcriptional regulator LsrR (DeoR family)